MCNNLIWTTKHFALCSSARFESIKPGAGMFLLCAIRDWNALSKYWNASTVPGICCVSRMREGSCQWQIPGKCYRREDRLASPPPPSRITAKGPEIYYLFSVCDNSETLSQDYTDSWTQIYVLSCVWRAGSSPWVITWKQLQTRQKPFYVTCAH